MIIVYGHRVDFKREGFAGQMTCQNCGHNVNHSLCRQINRTTIFWIPFINVEKQRGIMCESCGMISPISKQEYKSRKTACRN